MQSKRLKLGKSGKRIAQVYRDIELFVDRI